MKKPILLLINADSNWGSIGRITEQLGQFAQADGWDCHVVYGRCHNPSKLQTHCFTSTFSVIEHYLEHRLFDNEGLASRKATNEIVKFVEELQPNLIHLHNIHDHWLNYKILFEYLAKKKFPIIWTQHDCSSYTGGCGYYTMIQCEQWKSGCKKCPQKRGLLPLFEQTSNHYARKRQLINSIDNIIFVPVSHWLEGELRVSFLKEKHVVPIYNGVDIRVFQPQENNIKEKYQIRDKKLLLALATAWSERKGLKDYIELSRLLPKDVQLLLVGLSSKQIRTLPTSIIGIERTQNVDELVKLYSGAEIVMNLSYEETFGLTTVEGFACGTPSIVYNCTASPELVTPETGLIVEPGDISGVAKAVEIILNRGKDSYSRACRQRALDYYNKDARFADYIILYNKIIQQTL